MTNTNAADGGARSVHTLAIDKRRHAAITGVTDVCSFHETEVVLKIDSGVMILTGDSLHIAKLLLEDGRLEVDGHIDGSSMNRRKRPPGGLLPGSGAKNEAVF